MEPVAIAHGQRRKALETKYHTTMKQRLHIRGSTAFRHLTTAARNEEDRWRAVFFFLS
jgi:hypothetical protein